MFLSFEFNDFNKPLILLEPQFLLSKELHLRLIFLQVSRNKELLMKEALHIDSYPGPQIMHSKHIMGPCLKQQQLNKEKEGEI